MAAHGRLDILFNNAGVSFAAKVEDTTVDIWDRELRVHAKEKILGTRTAIGPCAKVVAGSTSIRPRSWASSAVPTSAAHWIDQEAPSR